MPVKITRKEEIAQTRMESPLPDAGASSTMEPVSRQEELTFTNAAEPQESREKRETVETVDFGRGLTPIDGSAEQAISTEAPPIQPPVVLHDIAAQRSFTLYKKDCQKIRDIQVHFLQNGFHVTESQVVRIALRALENSGGLNEMHMQIKSEDGRKHRQTEKRVRL